MESKKIQRSFKCYYCDAAITFDKNIRSINDKAVPLNLDKSPHDCPKSPYKLRKVPAEKPAAETVSDQQPVTP